MKLWKLIRQTTFREKEPAKGLLVMEWLCLGYMMLTALLILIFWQKMDHPMGMIYDRLWILGILLVLWGIYRMYPCRLLRFIRISVQMFMLQFWYPETYEFNRMFDNLDYWFASLEQAIFGCQPALLFGQVCSERIFSEAFNLGYFSYYPMMLVLMSFYFLYRYKEYEEASFILMCSFFLYYFIYMFLPVAGPQYYFQAVGVEWIKVGIFPKLGTYFSNNMDMYPAPGDSSGFFYQLVTSAQGFGERPTAAFPSSHVSITVIMLLLAFRTSKRMGFLLLPFSLLLFGATVYVQAHYVIDAIAGFITAFPVYFLTRWMYRNWFSNIYSQDCPLCWTCKK